MRALLIALLLLCLGSSVRAEHVYEDEHLRIRGNVPEAWIETAADLGKALYPALKAHFQKEPKAKERPLELVLYPDRAAFTAGMRAAGHRDPKHERSGGFTDWTQGISRVWIQADAFHTRRLVIHELVHQFHDKCQDPAHRGKGAFWYREGLAEWFGWHRRRGTLVDFGALDVVARGGTRATAVQRFAKGGNYPAWEMATGSKKADYADGLCLVAAFLGTRDEVFKGRFRAWELTLLKRGGGARSFLNAFRDAHAETGAVVSEFWRELRPWETTTPGWDERNELISGRATAKDAVLWAPPGLTRRVAVTVNLEAGEDVQAGFRLHAGRDHPQVAAVIGRGAMAILRQERGGWKVIASRTTKLSGANVRLQVRAMRAEMVLNATSPEGLMVLHAPLAAFGLDPGVSFLRTGLLVREGSARFWDFEATAGR